MQRRKRYKVDGIPFTVSKSTRKDKQLMAEFNDGKTIHFGDPDMPEYPGTKRGDNYCARSSGIKTTGNIMSANELSRKILWHCKGKKSMRTKKAANINIIDMEGKK